MSMEHQGLGPRVEGEYPGTDSGWTVLILGGGAMSSGRHRALESHRGRGPSISAGLGILNLTLNLNMKLSLRGLTGLGGAVPKL